MLTKGQGKCGYDWWWHSFTAHHAITGKAKPFFIEFFLCNPSSGSKVPIYGQLPANKNNGIKPSYLMIKVGHWGENASQLHRFFSWNDVNLKQGNNFKIEADDCYVDEKVTYGHVKVNKEDAYNHPEYMCDAGEMSWNLKIDKLIAFNVGYGASRLFRELQAFEMFWHAEGMKSTFDGEIILNGEKYIVDKDTSYGYSDKNWGKDFTSPWIWLSSNNLTSKITNKPLKDSVFDIGGGCPKIGPITLNRKLLSAFWYEGKGYEFNFSKFWTFTRTKFDCNETDEQIIWHVEQKTWRNKMVTDITCNKKDMLLINYEAPNGIKRHNRLWNGGNGKGNIKLYRDGRLIDEIYAQNVGCEYGDYNS